jgi:hypothetical protein
MRWDHRKWIAQESEEYRGYFQGTIAQKGLETLKITKKSWRRLMQHVGGEDQLTNQPFHFPTSNTILRTQEPNMADGYVFVQSCTNASDLCCDKTLLIHIRPSHWDSVLNYHKSKEYFNCTTSRKVAGSISDDAIRIFRWHNPSGRTMALRSTHPLTEMTTRNISRSYPPAGALG